MCFKGEIILAPVPGLPNCLSKNFISYYSTTNLIVKGDEMNMREFKRDNILRDITDEDFCRAVRRCLLADVEEDRRRKKKEKERSRRRSNRCGCRLF